MKYMFNFKMFINMLRWLRAFSTKFSRVAACKNINGVADERYLLAQMRIMAHVAQKNMEILSLRNKPIYFKHYLKLGDVLAKLDRLNLDSQTYMWARQVSREYERRFDYGS